jgi:hypothetical protein
MMRSGRARSGMDDSQVASATIYTRRKAGQQNLGSDRPPTVITVRDVEMQYHLPLNLAATNLVRSQSFSHFLMSHMLWPGIC